MTFAFHFKRFAVPFVRQVRTAHGAWTERRGLWIRLTNEKGDSGIAEMAEVPGFTGAWTEAWEETARSLGTQVEAETLRAAFTDGPAAWAVDEALRRVRGVASTPFRKFLPVAALLPSGRAALDAIPNYDSAGFRVFKWKVGVLDDRDEQVLLDDVLSALPDGSKLRLDANGAWDRRRAERWLALASDRPVEFVEQPISPEARGADDLLLGLSGDFPVALGLDESLVRGGDVERWLDLGWPGVFVVKPALMGSLGRYTTALAKAKAKVVFSSSLETRIGAEAALRAAFEYSGECLALGFGVWPLYHDNNYNGPYATPFVRWEDVEALKPEVLWNANS